MFQEILTISLTLGSLLLFCYWFRYACHLILAGATVRDYAEQTAAAHHLSFLEARGWLQQGVTEFGRVKNALDRDYAVLARLMAQAGEAQDGTERRMLAIHYSLMRAWYGATRSISASAARRALDEMSMVVAHLANSVGEAAAVSAAA